MRGQVSTEFIAVIGVVVLIFFFMVWCYVERRDAGDELNANLGRQNTCNKIASLVSAAYNGGPGFRLTKELTLKENVTIHTNGVVEYGGLENTFYCSTVPALHGDAFITQGGHVLTFTNTDGEVYING
ncbi:MAG: hypothetical protein NTU61_03675 [Candidatus Altiarchaeota archaeon]|nr:hypothetical protein [Candidatus Altiarchaeota archaeon]